MGIYPIPIWFMCKLCRCSFEKVEQFCDHKKYEHSVEFQNIKCIVFEETTIVNFVNSPKPKPIVSVSASLPVPVPEPDPSPLQVPVRAPAPAKPVSVLDPSLNSLRTTNIQANVADPDLLLQSGPDIVANIETVSTSTSSINTLSENDIAGKETAASRPEQIDNFVVEEVMEIVAVGVEAAGGIKQEYQELQNSNSNNKASAAAGTSSFSMPELTAETEMETDPFGSIMAVAEPEPESESESDSGPPLLEPQLGQLHITTNLTNKHKVQVHPAVAVEDSRSQHVVQIKIDPSFQSQLQIESVKSLSSSNQEDQDPNPELPEPEPEPEPGFELPHAVSPQLKRRRKDLLVSRNHDGSSDKIDLSSYPTVVINSVAYPYQIVGGLPTDVASLYHNNFPDMPIDDFEDGEGEEEGDDEEFFPETETDDEPIKESTLAEYESDTEDEYEDEGPSAPSTPSISMSSSATNLNTFQNVPPAATTTATATATKGKNLSPATVHGVYRVNTRSSTKSMLNNSSAQVPAPAPAPAPTPAPATGTGRGKTYSGTTRTPVPVPVPAPAQGKTWQCNICYKIFDSEPQLKLHGHICKVYNKNYVRTKQSLNFRELFTTKDRPASGAQHRNLSAIIRQDTSSSGSGSILKCSRCPMMFKNVNHLSRHEETHIPKEEQPRPFVCPVCHFAFRCRSYLKEHVKIHSEERPFRCTFEDCESTFKAQRYLTQHMVKHTDARPFVCPQSGCTCAYKTRQVLWQHMKSHSKEPVVKSPTRSRGAGSKSKRK